MKPFRCWFCQAELGLTDGEEFFAPFFSIRWAVTLYCRCGKHRVWKPLQKAV
jgi:hypothetical protein